MITSAAKRIARKIVAEWPELDRRRVAEVTQDALRLIAKTKQQYMAEYRVKNLRKIRKRNRDWMREHRKNKGQSDAT